MAELTANLATEVAEVCRRNAAEAAEAFARALDLEGVSLLVGEPGEVSLGELPEPFEGPGLVAVLASGGTAAILALPSSSGVVPGWCAAPDATGKSRLTTLAQELGMVLLPEPLAADDFQAACVKSLKGGLARGGVADGAALVPLELVAGKRRAGAMLVFPALRPGAVIGAGAVEANAAEKSRDACPPGVEPRRRSGSAAHAARLRRTGAVGVEDLPTFSRSLLRIRVPVVVTLAEKRQPLSQIMELGPGSIIQFEKSCEELLRLDIGGRPVAIGEAVKVGEKFGLRINAITLPDERFEPLKAPS